MRRPLIAGAAEPPELFELISSADLPADELQRLARVDAVLRLAAAGVRDADEAGRDGDNRRATARSGLSLPTTPPAATRSTRHRHDERTDDLKLGFRELALIYKSLQAARTLGALPPQDELLNDTIELVEQALDRAVSAPTRPT